MLLLIKGRFPATGLSLLLLDQGVLGALLVAVLERLEAFQGLRFLLVVVALVTNRMEHLLLVLLEPVLVAVVHLAGLKDQSPVVVPLQYLVTALVGVNQEVVGVVTPPEVVLTEEEQ
jgi:hypothetical protein